MPLPQNEVGKLHLFVVKYSKIFVTGAEIRRYNGDKQIFFDINVIIIIFIIIILRQMIYL